MKILFCIIKCIIIILFTFFYLSTTMFAVPTYLLFAGVKRNCIATHTDKTINIIMNQLQTKI